MAITRRMIYICTLWYVLEKRNGRNFKNQERTLEELKLFFFKSLFSWGKGIVCNGLTVHDFLFSIVIFN